MGPFIEITNRCIKCDNCRLICPENAIMTDGESYSVENWSCTLCHICSEVCPVECIKLVNDHL